MRGAATAARPGAYGYPARRKPITLPQRYRLDDHDRSIIEVLKEDGRAPLAHVGERVGLSPDAVRGRMNRLADDGVVRILGLVDPASLGYRCLATVGMRYHGSPEALTEALHSHPRVTYLQQVVGEYNVLCEITAYDDADLADVISQSLLTVEGVRDFEVWRNLTVLKWESRARPRPPVGERAPAVRPVLDQGDIELLRHLVENPRASYRELAARADLPYWAVRKRTQALFDTGTIQATAVVDRIKVQPTTLAMMGLKLGGTVRDDLAQLASFPEIAILTTTVGRYQAVAEVSCDSSVALSDLVERVLALNAVRDLSVLIYGATLVLPRPWRFDPA
ncbi:DNA-binding Lrp family transcriptional regulator [Thermobifida halotolerans]